MRPAQGSLGTVADMNTFATTEALPAAPSRALHPTRPIRPTRRDVWDLLCAALAAFADTDAKRAAWQGARGAAEQWRFSTGPSDLDIWCNDAAFGCLSTVLGDLGAARVQHADDPRRAGSPAHDLIPRRGRRRVRRGRHRRCRRDRRR